MKLKTSIGISYLAYSLPSKTLSLKELVQQKKVHSSIETLREFGFEHCFVNSASEDLLLLSGKKISDMIVGKKISLDSLFLYSGINKQEKGETSLSLFQYAAPKIHHELNLENCPALSFSDQGCTGLLSLIDIASRLLQTSEKEAILCLVGDTFPEKAEREIIYNVMSDAGAAILIQKNALKNKIIHFYQQTQSYYWDTTKRSDELLAAYFPMAERVISECLKSAGLTIDDITWFVPHNVSYRSWKILAELLAVPEDKIWSKNIARIGHTVSCDHVINLVDMEEQNVLKKGDLLVLFTFGFGASWSCLILEH